MTSLFSIGDRVRAINSGANGVIEERVAHGYRDWRYWVRFSNGVRALLMQDDLENAGGAMPSYLALVWDRDGDTLPSEMQP